MKQPQRRNVSMLHSKMKTASLLVISGFEEAAPLPALQGHTHTGDIPFRDHLQETRILQPHGVSA
eukprot:CAMPEP_0178458790 /NCGR_PEP_ID=MMETSP0689_2-20121128/47733_1 /TAXON_ID=160604 /ORGANISM="Amphidinium massartii, Strain CS-259" /LENGTH=64 /DNA_ID=CAMNT_0020085121 /DNA_START=545 /DNA_END=739 /DNA_ORIENTATION=+